MSEPLAASQTNKRLWLVSLKSKCFDSRSQAMSNVQCNDLNFVQASHELLDSVNLKRTRFDTRPSSEPYTTSVCP